MDLQTVEMDKDEARDRYREYAEVLKRRHTEEDEMIAAGYKAIADGHKIISLPKAIGRSGVDELGRPKLAIAPANAQFVWMKRSHHGSVVFSPRNHVRGKLPTGSVTVLNALPSQYISWELTHFHNRAMVPIVPPRLRPTELLTTYHILFEAVWEPVPPVDPALLRHLRGDLWIVVAEWDLTDLERAVLAERFQSPQ